MAQLFRDLSLGHSKRDTTPSPPPKIMPPKPSTVADDLPSPLGQLAANLSDSELALTAYEIFVAACRTSSGKPLTSSVTNSSSNNNHSGGPPSHNPSAIQRSLTSTAASKVKKAFGLKSPGSGSKKSPGSGSGPGKPKRPLTVGELMRNQMRVSEAVDSRVRRALLRISAGQVALTIHITSMILR